MDRFIANPRTKMITEGKYLKSNMDRFIALVNFHDGFSSTYLKSNMDRFIAEMGISDVENMSQFKIQYG